LKFIKKTKEESDKPRVDDVEDPSILMSQLINTNKSFRHKKWTHVRISEIDSFCPRAYALAWAQDEKTESYVHFALQQQFDIGSAMHWYLQNFSKVFKDNFYSLWKCVACGNMRVNDDGSLRFSRNPRFFDKKGKCEHCGASNEATFCEEFMFRMDSPYRTVGKMDGVIKVDEGVYRFLDFKTFFDESNLPKGSDFCQVASYCYFYNFLEEKDKLPVTIDTSIGYLFYVSKKMNFREPIKAFPVEVKGALIDPIKEKVAKFTDAVDNGNIPEPFEPCTRNFEAGKAKKCEMRELCQERL